MADKEVLDLRNKNIVVIYMLYFGDMISLSPFLSVLRRNALNSHISLVVDSRFQEPVLYNPNVDRIIPVDRKHMNMIDTWHLGKQLGKEIHPDILIVLHSTLRTLVMGLGMHADYWTGETSSWIGKLLMNRVLTVERRDCHAAEKYVQFLTELGGVTDTSYKGLELYTCPEWENAARVFYQKHGIIREKVENGNIKLIGVSVGSSTAEKNWPAERYGQLADHFTSLGYIPVFFGVPSERSLIDQAMAAMRNSSKAIVAAGELSMGEFMAASSWCKAAFTNDSGPMYVFDSRGVPTIAMFGPSNAKLHHPLGNRSCAIASTDMPQTQDHVGHTIRDGNYTPIDHIPVKDVIEAGEWALGLRDSDTYKNHFVVVQ